MVNTNRINAFNAIRLRYGYNPLNIYHPNKSFQRMPKKDKPLNAVKWVRKIRDEAYKAWKKDPVAFKKEQEKSANEFFAFLAAHHKNVQGL